MMWAFSYVLQSSNSEVEDLKCSVRSGAAGITLILYEFAEVSISG